MCLFLERQSAPPSPSTAILAPRLRPCSGPPGLLWDSWAPPFLSFSGLAACWEQLAACWHQLAITCEPNLRIFMKKVSEMVSKSMLFGDFSLAHVQIEKPRLDCAGCSETWVRPSRRSLEIEEKTQDMLTLSTHSLFRRNFVKKVLQRGPFGDLWASFCCSGDPLGAQRVPKSSKRSTK